MKNRISKAFSEDKLEHRENITYSEIHVADLTERTGSRESIVIYDAKPEGIDTMLIENPDLNITATFFKPQCLINEHGKEPDNCEGVFYLSDSTDKTWVLFFEIKDCKAKNISKFFTDSKEQIKTIVKIFRDKAIIAADKRVFANVSFPRKNKTDFYHQFIKQPESKQFLDDYNIFIRGTNTLKIKNDQKIV